MAQMRGRVVMIAIGNRWPTPLAASKRGDLTCPYAPMLLSPWGHGSTALSLR